MQINYLFCFLLVNIFNIQYIQIPQLIVALMMTRSKLIAICILYCHVKDIIIIIVMMIILPHTMRLIPL